MNKLLSGLAALSALALVAGCATDDMATGASVTRFHLGQEIARGPIAVESVDPRDTGSLEFAQVSASVARELTRLGWTVVPNNASEQVAMVSLTQQSREAARRSGVSIGIGGGTASYGRHGGVGVVQAAVTGSGRQVQPMRRLQALDPAAFLIDEHEDFVACDGSLEVGDERPELLRVAAIAPKQNQAAGAALSKVAPLVIVERQARTTGDECLVVHEAGLTRAAERGQAR